ncbi:PDZ domain-containing protein [Paenibacillus sp.]|uniref:YlbL family protein n=1 Tax=Paenibacillus sp. TaxID=58172 RepID=UPI002D43B9F2|nr:PDZ domain-containing protein [Paenibacillus sp.]HZG84452.1 PDZ domain-containing protein [Paenibacillus sp.]
MNPNVRMFLRTAWPAFLGLAAALLLWFAVPVPYIVYQPGPVASTRPMVETPAAPEADETDGAYMLTTVRWMYANVFAYAWARLDPDAELLDKQTVTRGASRTDYVARQRLQMRASHANAIEAAYRELGIPYEPRSLGISVFTVMDGSAADGALRPGDVLLAIDGKALAAEDDVKAALSGKAAGDDAMVTFRRGSDERSERLTLRPIPNADPPRPGLGITYGMLQTVASVDPAYRVTVKPGSIGGPSAGLMFALEIYDRFTEGDGTKGYVIAGTGEISPDGTVGRIGGVGHKVTGASRKGAELFFVPADNADAARAKAAELGTNMRIVPVASLREALDYLASLPEKETRTGGL